MDIKQVRLGVQVELIALNARMGACEKTGQELTAKADEFAAKADEFAAKTHELTGNFTGVKQPIELLVVRFNEAMEMLVQNHTDAIQKQAAMQTELDAVKARLDALGDLPARLESLEKRLPPAAA